jgi:glycosyltransferase involved in cell wall biosynthesis
MSTTAERASRVAEPPGVSIVMAVLNEERHLRTAVDAALSQDYPGPLELVVSVGPSRDRTAQIAADLAAKDPRITVVESPTGRTPAGLNLAVAKTKYPIVARVDGHALLPPGYLETAVNLLETTGADNVGGIMAAEGTTAFEEAVARAMTTRLGVGNAPFHHGGAAGPADTVYLGVFRRETLLRLGGYDESFLRAQDWELNYRIREAGGLVYFTPDLQVTYRPRTSLGALARQYFHYGRWRRTIIRHHPGSVSPRYLAPPLTLVAVVAGTVVGAVWTPWAFIVPGGYVVGVLGGAAVTGRGLPAGAWIRLPLVYATMHGAWGLGFLSASAYRAIRNR